MSGDHAIAVSAGGRHKRPLLIAFGLTLGYMVVEIVAGLVANSVALLSDALHMGTDVLGLGMALAAVQLASRPAPAHRTYGTYRLEVLAALANGVLLFGVALYILYEARQRLADPETVTSGVMLIVAVVGLGVNLVSYRLLTAGARESLNVKGAFFEVLSDLLGSIGVIRRGNRRAHRVDLRGPHHWRRHRLVHPAPDVAALRPGRPHPDGGRATGHRNRPGARGGPPRARGCRGP